MTQDKGENKNDKRAAALRDNLMKRKTQKKERKSEAKSQSDDKATS